MRISLTFDDGPNTVTTPAVLEILEQYHVKASFFLIGQCITEESNEMIKRQITDGCTIENHSWTHADMTKFTKEQIQEEIKRTSDVIMSYTGDTPQFFRPPYICVNQTMYDSISLPFICGMGVEDWVPEVSAEKRASAVINGVCDGQIILLHDLEGNTNTVEALKTIIPTLQQKGVQFMTIRELFADCEINPLKKNKIWTNVFK